MGDYPPCPSLANYRDLKSWTYMRNHHHQQSTCDSSPVYIIFRLTLVYIRFVSVCVVLRKSPVVCFYSLICLSSDFFLDFRFIVPCFLTSQVSSQSSLWLLSWIFCHASNWVDNKSIALGIYACDGKFTPYVFVHLFPLHIFVCPFCLVDFSGMSCSYGDHVLSVKAFQLVFHRHETSVSLWLRKSNFCTLFCMFVLSVALCGILRLHGDFFIKDGC